MPSPTRNFSRVADAGRLCEAWISSKPVVGLIRTTEPDEARMSRTASLTINWSAAIGSSVEWMTLLTW